jgi:hypothetical protein
MIQVILLGARVQYNVLGVMSGHKMNPVTVL